ncbi:FliI/YscN family ATPase [Desulfacinum hydrothermale]|uniref:FliI/YscN family ATPase n=1 Tax=Desulfacinum hydrothermale TaxID=109258 RepID=UPI00111BD61C
MQLEGIEHAIATAGKWKRYGKVHLLVGNLIEAVGLEATLGTICKIHPEGNAAPVFAEVVGFQGKNLKLVPLSPVQGLAPGNRVEIHPHSASCPVGPQLLGRVLNGMGEPVDGLGPVAAEAAYPLRSPVPNPMDRPIISQQLDVGIRAINGLLPLGKGQRMGIFAGSGVGKSTLLGMMARYTTAPVNVIALIGERGREVNEFLESELGPEGRKRSVVVVATSDQPASLRVRAAYVACAVAEYFRDQGQDVLFMMDSVTRFAMAMREIGLAAGEPPTTKGYPPSVFGALPQLLERSGSFPQASITGIYTVLVEGDDLDDPIADTVRSILDGHIVLDRDLAHRRHYPAINPLKSVSRLTDRLLDPQVKDLASRFIEVLAQYKAAEDMINIGAYVRGSHGPTDYAIQMIDKLNDYLKQNVEDRSTIEESHQALRALFL